MLRNLTEVTIENNPVEKVPKLKLLLQEKFPGLSS